MVIEKHIKKEHPEDIEYVFIVSTDSSFERDIILRHLAIAQEEYEASIKKQTKPAKIAKVEFSSRQPKAIEGFSASYCKCGLTHYFKPDSSGWWQVICPDPEYKYKSEILITKRSCNE